MELIGKLFVFRVWGVGIERRIKRNRNWKLTVHWDYIVVYRVSGPGGKTRLQV